MNETVSEESTVASTVATNVVRQTRPVLSQCKICEAPARYAYYGTVVCQSCKMFFKRNAEARSELLKCPFQDDCEININNRHVCSSCRIKKCFAIGMRSEMIRCSRPKKNKRNQEEKPTSDSIPSTSTSLVALNNTNHPEQICTLNLLRSDQSTLSASQWTLLSNLIHCFDEHSGYSFVERLIQDQNSLPPKLRFKCSLVKDFYTSMKTNIQLVFEKNRDFLSLSSNDRTTLLRTTVKYTTSMGGLFTLRKAHLFDDPSFFKSTEIIFRSTAAAFSKRVIDHLDSDDTFIKLVLAILSFSTTNYTIYSNFDPTNLTNIKTILSIENMYIELAWQYVLYKYGHHQAVRSFLNLIRCIFFLNDALLEAHESQHFNEMIDTVLQKTKQTLTL